MEKEYLKIFKKSIKQYYIDHDLTYDQFTSVIKTAFNMYEVDYLIEYINENYKKWEELKILK